jgi:succinate-semialdehyde dehydrogenase/glutarate-semialdehyde dehydrogenase
MDVGKRTEKPLPAQTDPERGGETAVTHSLKDATLFRQAALVGGDWIAADPANAIAVTNPATGAVIGHVPKLGAAETRTAIEAARTAQADWAARTAKDRAGILRAWFNLMMENQEDLGRILTLEQGKP